MADPALWFPGANTSHLAPSDGGSILGGEPKCLWHDPETTGLPSYSTGSFPNMTICSGTPYQHSPANRAGRALKNPDGGCQTNRWNVFQIECCGYANKVAYHQTMADVAGWLAERRGVPLRYSVTWKAYDASYGQSNGVRLSCGSWETYSGHCAHMHAPENDHGDTGAPFPIDQILAAAGGAPAPEPEPELPPEVDVFILRCDATSSADGRKLRLLQGNLWVQVSTDERAHLVSKEHVVEYDITGHPGLYDKILRTAEEAPA
jgi:hypothetical protein